jgi:methyl-accepting chemotaxis protein
MGMLGIFKAGRVAEDMAALSRSQAMIVFTPDGIVLDANENFCNALHYQRSEIVGQHHRIFCEDAVRNSPDYAQHWSDLAAGKFKRGQFRRQAKDHSDVWIEASYNPVLHGGKVVRVLKIASDITESKLVSLHDANRLRAIDKSQAIIEFDPDGTVVEANENFLKAMGYQLGEVRGKHHRMFCDPAYIATREYAQFWERLRAGEFVADNFTRVGKGGRQVWIQAAYTPVFNSRGAVYRIVKVAADITARMQAVGLISKAIGKLADGDLTVEVTETIDAALEQTRLDFNGAAKSLRDTVAAIRRSSDSLASNAQVIRHISDDIAKGSEHQAASLEETAASLEEINTSVKDSTQRAGQARELVKQTRVDAETSGTIVREAVMAMARIDRSSQQISNIIGVIDEIAFQTNLLALNAGVEAARAGEAGKGFAVVAQEVRELAQRSATAAKEIKSLIAEAGAAVGEGVSLVDRTGKALDLIVTKVQEVDDNVSAIAASAQEQALGISGINGAINALDQVTQRSAATVEEASAASQSLADEADSLTQLISKFRVAAGERTERAPAVTRRRSA